MLLQKRIHSGWRRILGSILIIFGLTSAAFYYIEMYAINRSLIKAADNVVSPSPKLTSTTSSASSPGSKQTPNSTNGRIHLNSATQAELESLPKIGEKKALDIMSYRQKHLFRSIEELKNIKGIGVKTLEQLKPLVDL